MQTPLRLLRADAQDFDRNPPDLSPREWAQYDRIVEVGRSILARRGCHAVSLAGLAQALRMAPTTLRRHFPDMDALLGTILRQHLRNIAIEIGKIPHSTPDLHRQRRAAYLAFTRTALGGFTEAHLLLVRDRHTLPDDILPSIEQTRLALGGNLAGDMACEALSHLDNPFLAPPRIEAILALPEAAEIIPAAIARAPIAAKIQPPPKLPAAENQWQETTTLENATPGAWIYTAGIPKVSRAPPRQNTS